MENNDHFTGPVCVVKTTVHTFHGIQSFQEKPCEGRFDYENSVDDQEIPANILFSLFTADIIKEEVVFTR